MAFGPISQLTMPVQTAACKGHSQRSLLGILRQGPQHPAQVAQVQNKKRRLAQQLPRLPTIVEGEEDEDGATSHLHPLPSGLPEMLTDALSLIGNAKWAETVALLLKAACKTERTVLLAWLSTAVVPLAFSDNGSYVVQVACKVASGTQRILLYCKLQGSIADLCISANGYQVVSTLVETMPVSAIGFVAQEMSGRAGEIARNRFGYRVLEAMTMHCSEAQMAGLAKELVLDCVELSRHAYGNFVIQHLLEYGTAACQSDIVQRLIPEMPMMAMDRTASHVVEKALGHVQLPEQLSISVALLQPAKTVSVVDIACSRCGSSILIQLAKSDEFAEELRLQLARSSPRLVQSKFGRRVIGHFALPSSIRMPNTHVLNSACVA